MESTAVPQLALYPPCRFRAPHLMDSESLGANGPAGRPSAVCGEEGARVVWPLLPLLPPLPPPLPPPGLPTTTGPQPPPPLTPSPPQVCWPLRPALKARGRGTRVRLGCTLLRRRRWLLGSRGRHQVGVSGPHWLVLQVLQQPLECGLAHVSHPCTELRFKSTQLPDHVRIRTRCSI
jgi:hypothetical protein